MRDLAEVCAEIAAIPSVEELVALLRSKNIKGLRKSMTECPIASYIYLESGRTVRVTDSGPVGCAYADGHQICNVANTFIKKFDHGDFPELEL